MRLIFQSMGRYKKAVALCIFIKLAGTASELLLPYILEHIIDNVAPLGRLGPTLLWGLLMFAAAVVCRQLNVYANRQAIGNAHQVSRDIRQELFRKTVNLSGSQFDSFGLPSLISRMTSDSYNVQSAVQQLQTLCVRAPTLLIGGVCVSLMMDPPLAMILIAMLPVLILVVFVVTAKGLPMFAGVQRKLDAVVRVMRENITGIRVVKALSKTEYEKRRFAQANQDMTRSDIAASTVMAIPSPLMQLCVNSGLAIVVLLGAGRVNAGQMKPGVILSFLTYFNMINMGLMGLSRIFMTLSKAGASAGRIDEVLRVEAGQRVLPKEEARTPAGDEFIRFEHVSFSYGEEDSGGFAGEKREKTSAGPHMDAKRGAPDLSGFAGEKREKTSAGPHAETKRSVPDLSGFAGERREKALNDISFALKRGESLGIIGPTGCGKSTIIALLMRFYDAGDGGVFVDGRDVRTYDKDELRRKFGVCFQNDMVFQDTLRENVRFGRDVDEARFRAAIEDAMAAEYIDALEDGPEYQAAIKGANLSGGQKQRLLVARALAADPEILVLDDSSSALDYKTDAAMRGAICRNHAGSTLIMIAQRVSSIMGMTHILVVDNGKCVGYGTHQELMETCPAYRETCQVQMGEMA